TSNSSHPARASSSSMARNLSGRLKAAVALRTILYSNPAAGSVVGAVISSSSCSRWRFKAQTARATTNKAGTTAGKDGGGWYGRPPGGSGGAGGGGGCGGARGGGRGGGGWAWVGGGGAGGGADRAGGGGAGPE